jgi:UDPglucose--hexose-1-phosphate uridylyltransferase
VELRCETYTGEILDPRDRFRPMRTEVEVRWDPLIGYSSRLVRGPEPLLGPSTLDLETEAEGRRDGCPFCAPNVTRATPKLAPAISASGRIQHGEALLFPNLLTYWQHSSVSIYSPQLHFLPLDRMTPTLMGDNLTTQVEFVRAVTAYDRRAAWASINANHMPPSGSSIFHPHLQGGADPAPSTLRATPEGLVSSIPAQHRIERASPAPLPSFCVRDAPLNLLAWFCFAATYSTR